MGMHRAHACIFYQEQTPRFGQTFFSPQAVTSGKIAPSSSTHARAWAGRRAAGTADSAAAPENVRSGAEQQGPSLLWPDRSFIGFLLEAVAAGTTARLES